MGSNDTLIFSIYGAIFEEGQRGFSLKTLCAMLERLGLSAEASRLALSRMARRGFLFTKRKGKASFYFLSEAGLAQMKQGESRSLGRGKPAAWDGKFSLLSYELPESLRDERVALAETLRCAGFGRAAAGLWVFAYEMPEAIRDRIGRPPLAGFVETWRATHEGDSLGLARRIWKLDEREGILRAYLEKYSKARDDFLARRNSGKVPSDADCFARYFESLGDFVEAMASVPPLPAELLPPDWPAAEALELFVSYRRLVHEGTSAFFDSVYEPF